ncbi:MAG TPA: hypothetical protein VL095_09475 [Flavisolibacter sp.]|nr:hypothetical protein [Flavisolibacter sp.]
MKTATYKFGFVASLIAFLAAAGYCIVQILQVLNLIHFPVADILIYGFSLCIAIPFMLAIMALNQSVPEEKKLWSYASLLLSVLYAVYASFVYTVQLATVIPEMINKNSSSLQVLVMTPHSFFWSLDALTYICLGLSTLFGAFAFEKRGIEKTARWFFLANALITPVIAFVYFYPQFSSSLIWIGSPWIITAPGSMLVMSMYFARKEDLLITRRNCQAELVEVWEE